MAANWCCPGGAGGGGARGGGGDAGRPSTAKASLCTLARQGLLRTPTALDAIASRDCTQNGGAGSKNWDARTTLTDCVYLESGAERPSSSKPRTTGYSFA